MRTSAAPRGPRNGSPSTRNGGRGGGIQKRRAGPAVRLDKDGDLEMDAGATRVKSGKGSLTSSGPPGARGTGRGRGGVSRVAGNLGAHRTQAAILRGMSTKQANIVESRLTTGTAGTMLKVDGLRLSKAASNPDGGLESLLGFLERKASGLDSKSNRSIKIKKVCLVI
jgi:nuclear RNA export factor